MREHASFATLFGITAEGAVEHAAPHHLDRRSLDLVRHAGEIGGRELIQARWQTARRTPQQLVVAAKHEAGQRGFEPGRTLSQQLACQVNEGVLAGAARYRVHRVPPFEPVVIDVEARERHAAPDDGVARAATAELATGRAVRGQVPAVTAHAEQVGLGRFHQGRDLFGRAIDQEQDLDGDSPGEVGLSQKLGAKVLRGAGP